MNTELLNIINKYQSAIEVLFPKVAKHLNVELPISNNNWAGLTLEQRGVTPCGIKYFKHGYGISMNDGNMSADFDLGDKGQINGFDAWRLADFVIKNNIKTSLSNGKVIETAIADAVKTGDVTFSGYLLYYINYGL